MAKKVDEIEKNVFDKIDEIVPKKKEKTDEEFLIDEPENLFFRAQKIFWRILKTVFIFGALGFLLFLIWNPEKNPLQKNFSIKKVFEKSAEKIKNISKKEEKISEKKIEIEKKNSEKIAENSISAAISWLKNSQKFLEIPPKELISRPTADLRAQRIKKILEKIREMREDATKIRKKLATEISNFAKISAEQKKIADAKIDETLRAVDEFDKNTEKFFFEKIAADKNFRAAQSHQKFRQILQQKIDAHAAALAQISEILTANKKILIQNLQVVEFPNDPFDPILTPAEWRKK